MILLALMGLSEEFLLSSLLYEATKAESLTELPKVTQLNKIQHLTIMVILHHSLSLFQIFLFEFYFLPIKKVRCLNSRSID